MSRFLSLDELLNKKKTQVSKPVYVAPVIEDTPKAEDSPVEDTHVIEDTPKAEDSPVEDTHVIEDTPKAEDAPIKPAKKSSKKAAVEA